MSPTLPGEIPSECSEGDQNFIHSKEFSHFSYQISVSYFSLWDNCRKRLLSPCTTHTQAPPNHGENEHRIKNKVASPHSKKVEATKVRSDKRKKHEMPCRWFVRFLKPINNFGSCKFDGCRLFCGYRSIMNFLTGRRSIIDLSMSIRLVAHESRNSLMGLHHGKQSDWKVCQYLSNQRCCHVPTLRSGTLQHLWLDAYSQTFQFFSIIRPQQTGGDTRTF